jgi:trehalose 6-phosphate phosphatase
MKYLFARSNQAILQQFALSKVLLAFDYDGTLAPITDRPEAAAMRPSTLILFGQVAKSYACVVISGRARVDVLPLIKQVKVREVIGNHGAEPWQDCTRLSREVKAWRPVLERNLAHIPGVVIEDKSLSVSVHYRLSRAKKKALATIRQTVSLLGDVRLIPGKQVVNIVPKGAHHKGIALQEARLRYGCDTAIFVGDDETDEDAFAIDQPARLLTIRVGAKRTSSADYYLRTQNEIDQLLRLLLAYRSQTADRLTRARPAYRLFA